MNETPTIEPFARYGALLDMQAQLQDDVGVAAPGETVELYQRLDVTNRDIAAQRLHPELMRSALYCGAVMAHAVIGDEHKSDAAARLQAGHRLAQASELLWQDPANPELTDNDQFYDIQTALGILAAETIDTSALPEPEMAAVSAPVDYNVALQNLRDCIAAMEPGEQYKLSPAQVLTLAAPTMAFSRWQRWQLLKRARAELNAAGYEFQYNNGRGKSSFYTLGRPAATAAEVTLPIAA